MHKKSLNCTKSQSKRHKQVTVKVTAYVDEGIKELVEVLNAIPGVCTIESCEGYDSRPACVSLDYGTDYNNNDKFDIHALVEFADKLWNTIRNSELQDDNYSEIWGKMYHFFMFNRNAFLAHYHKRSNVESTFAMIKGKFGDAIRSKGAIAQVNELLLKILCHNICVLIQALYELGIETTFCAENMVTQKVSDF
ncbi:transposase [Chloroflexota bacterium]